MKNGKFSEQQIVSAIVSTPFLRQHILDFSKFITNIISGEGTGYHLRILAPGVMAFNDSITNSLNQQLIFSLARVPEAVKGLPV